MPFPDADVIIVGAGPAGTLAAYELAIKGISVLVLEKSGFPRYKVCGGGLTYKVLGQVPYDLSQVIDTEIHTIHFSSGFTSRFSRTSPDPLMFCTMRDKLDAFMADMAVSAGAGIRFSEQVIGLEQSKTVIQVTTKRNHYSSSLLIGADGASGIVPRLAGLRGNTVPGLAWEAEISAEREDIEQFSQTVFLDWGTFPGGYGWVFPKKDHFSIGVGGPARLSRWMIPYYTAFLKYLSSGIPPAEQGIRFGETRSLKSWPIPVRIRKSLFHDNRVMVTGDAAGLTDPLTGEGIYYAVRSGKLAALACLDYLNTNKPSLSHYSEMINEEIMTELMEANRIKHIFNTVPLKIHYFVRDNERGWKAFGKILRGERTYRDVKMGFGKWKILWKMICRAAGWIESWKESRFKKKGLNQDG